MMKKTLVGIVVVGLLVVGGIGVKYVYFADNNKNIENVELDESVDDTQLEDENNIENEDSPMDNEKINNEVNENGDKVAPQKPDGEMNKDEMKNRVDENGNQGIPQKPDGEMNKEEMESKMEDMKTKADEAGMSVDEYLKSMRQEREISNQSKNE